MEHKSSPSVNENSEEASVMTPKFLPAGELLGWSLHTYVDPKTNTLKGTYSVSVQVAKNHEVPLETVKVTCDGPCGGLFKSSRLMSMGKCDHVLCKACYGLVKNQDGSYGCSNFYCWADARKSFRQEKAKYRHVIKRQSARAIALKSDGEDLKVCSEADLPETPCSTPPLSSEISALSFSSASSSWSSSDANTSSDFSSFSDCSGFSGSSGSGSGY